MVTNILEKVLEEDTASMEALLLMYHIYATIILDEKKMKEYANKITHINPMAWGEVKNKESIFYVLKKQEEEIESV